MNIVDEEKTYRCTKGHTWKACMAGENFHIDFSTPTSGVRRIENLCLQCMYERVNELFKDVGRVEEVKES